MTSTSREESQSACLCCGSEYLDHRTAVVSGFLAERAWHGQPELTRLATCSDCGFRYFERRLSEVEAQRLYKGYRDTTYLRARRRWEPFYTEAAHNRVIGWAQSESRIADLTRTLTESGLPNRFEHAIDHGGSGGHMLRAVNAIHKVVFDPSGFPPIEGVSAICDASQLQAGCDLLLSCQVLEHVSDPRAYLRSVSQLCRPGAYLYLEVPDERWRETTGTGSARDAWLGLLVRHHHLLKLADCYSTAFRVLFRILPPFGFVAMREHINYFSLSALRALVDACGLQCLTAGRNGQGQWYAIARKS